MRRTSKTSSSHPSREGRWLRLALANPRHAHEFRYVRDLVRDGDQIIVAGVIDTTTNFVEHPEVVADRLERIVAVVGDPSRVMAGTDCGFESRGRKRTRSGGRGLGEARIAERRRPVGVLASVLETEWVAPVWGRHDMQKQS